MKVGTDIVVIKRVEKLLEKFGEKFLDRFLNDEEKKTAKKIETIAGYWAGKEAISKAIGSGIGVTLSFLDIIIYKDNRGTPHFKLTPKAQKIHKIKESSLSISHDGGFAVAVAIIS